MDRLIIGTSAWRCRVQGRDGRPSGRRAHAFLAYQHFESFRAFAAFPAKIDLLSRFRSTKEQKAVVEAAEKGDVDVLIGTHRVLSNDVRLPKLGLVVVDEQSSASHKEKLKQLKKKVDVLTLSATPIPRTLNMSMLGMRDMSVIETPPRDRLAINSGGAVLGERDPLRDRAGTRPQRSGVLHPQPSRRSRPLPPSCRRSSRTLASPSGTAR